MEPGLHMDSRSPQQLKGCLDNASERQQSSRNWFLWHSQTRSHLHRYFGGSGMGIHRICLWQVKTVRNSNTDSVNMGRKKSKGTK